MNSPVPSLVPELLVTDTPRSLAFWCGLCGFEIRYERVEEGFAYLTLGTAHVMLDEIGERRTWETAELEPPLGRGINFQIEIQDLSPVLAALRGASWPLFVEPETKWYRISDREEVGVEQFLVTDPDGYLIRFQTKTGTRSIER